MAALTFVLKTVWSNISDDVFAKAKARLEDWFGPAEPSALKIPASADERCQYSFIERHVSLSCGEADTFGCWLFEFSINERRLTSVVR